MAHHTTPGLLLVGPPGRREVKPNLTLGIVQLVCSLIANKDHVVLAYCMPLQVRQQQEQCTALHQAAAERLQHWRKLLQTTQGAVDVAVSVQLVFLICFLYVKACATTGAIATC